jgi:pyruvate/2-oxoglutarate dehydrogenase complex dihydrolipoamide dehydrogenase (E3) component
MSKPELVSSVQIRWLDNAKALNLDSLPESLVVTGGGLSGLEFAQMFARFGAKVTVLESEPRILPRHEPDIAAELQRCLEEEGIAFHLGVRVQEVAEQDDKKMVLFSKGERVEKAHWRQKMPSLFPYALSITIMRLMQCLPIHRSPRWASPKRRR